MTSDIRSSSLAKIVQLKHRIPSALNSEGLEYVLEKPIPTLNENASEDDMKTHQKHLEDDLKARAIMLLQMDDGLFEVFESHKTAKEMFEAIARQYDITWPTYIQLLSEQYTSCKMRELDDVMEHVNKMLVMAKDLATAGFVIADGTPIFTIIKSLPASWSMVATVLRVTYESLELTKLPLILAVEQEHMSRDKKSEEMITQDKSSSSYVLVRPKKFKIKNNNGKFDKGKESGYGRKM